MCVHSERRVATVRDSTCVSTSHPSPINKKREQQRAGGGGDAVLNSIDIAQSGVKRVQREFSIARAIPVAKLQGTQT